MYFSNSNGNKLYMYELTIAYSYAPFSYNLFLIYLAFGITAGDPGGCHVTPGWGRDIIIFYSESNKIEVIIFCCVSSKKFKME